MVTTVSNMVSEAKQRVENLTVDQVSQELERGEALVVDLREPEERAQEGVIPGAVFAPRGMLEYWADPRAPTTARSSIPTDASSCTVLRGDDPPWPLTCSASWATRTWRTWTVA